MAKSLTKNTTPPRAKFVIHQNPQGYWVASEKGGLVTGVFAIEREALRFALSRMHGGILHSHVAQKPR